MTEKVGGGIEREKAPFIVVKPLYLVRSYEKFNVEEQETEYPTFRTYQRLVEAFFFSVFVSMILGRLSQPNP